MDRNTVIGFVLIGAILFAFSWLNQPSKEEIALKLKNDSIALVQQAKVDSVKSRAALEKVQIATEQDTAKLNERFGAFATAAKGTETFQTLENKFYEVKFTNKGGRVYSVRLKDYQTHDSLPLILFQGEESSLGLTLNTKNGKINTADLYFTPILKDSTLTMRLAVSETSYLDFVYTIRPENYLMKFDVKSVGLSALLANNSNAIELDWYQKLRQQEKSHKSENRYSQLYFKNAGVDGDYDYLSDTSDDEKRLKENVKWVAFKGQFFTTALIANSEFTGVDVSSKLTKEVGFLKEYHTTASVAFAKNSEPSASFSYYFGPNHYPTLRALDKGVEKEHQLRLDKVVPLGFSFLRWINQVSVIPLFNFFEKWISSYGIIILLLTLVIKLVLFPLTYKSYISSAKMRVLRPQIEELNEKFPGNDKAMERQKATMDLYRRAGVNPMAGCVPMLLQMPILIAMYMFFPSSIELRQQSFLWANDLSTYDSIYSWSQHIPFLSDYYGNHISLFVLLMTATNIVYTKFNMEATNTGQAQMPGMKTMMYLMPLMFLFFLNEFAAGLSYYYFISTLITILQTLAFRQFVNEEKLLAKLHENQKKPAKKKSGFMARLEEAQKQQMEIQKKKAAQKGKK